MDPDRLPPIRAWIAVGANLGDRASTIDAAVDAIAALPGVLVAARSSLRETAPVGGPANQPAYLNGAIEVEVSWTAPPPSTAPRDSPPQNRPPQDASRDEVAARVRRLIEQLLSIERALGRVRDPHERNAARTIDLDLLLVEVGGQAAVISEENLEVPHPRMHERRFVLEPLAEIAPDLRHPLLGATVAELLRRLPLRTER